MNTAAVLSNPVILTVLGTGGTLFLGLVGTVVHYDNKLEKSDAKSEIRFESIRSELRSVQSELLGAISSVRGDRIKALEVQVAAMLKK